DAEVYRLAEHPRRRADGGEELEGNAEVAGELRVPVEALDVEAEGPGGVRGIGGMDAAAGQSPEEPAVHGPEAELAPLRPQAELRPGDEKPGDLRLGVVGVHHQTGPRADGGLEPVGAHPLTQR